MASGSFWKVAGIVVLCLFGFSRFPLAQVGGVVASYSFQEGAGTTTADASGNNLVGTLTNGPAWTTGRVGNGLSFDGVNDFVNLGNPTQLRLTGSMTISAWIFATGAPPINDDAVIVSKRTSGQSGYQLDTTPDTGSRTIGFKLTNSAGANMMRFGATTLQTNQWYHIVGVYDAAASAMHVYLNGVLNDGSLVGTVTATQQNSTQNVNIGRRPGSPGTFEFNGKLDEVQIYNRPLTAGEVQTLYSAGVGPPPTVTINQAVGQADPTNVVPVNYTVVFSEAVTGFATGDVTLGGTAGATTATVTGSGTTYNVAVTGMTQPGTITTTVGAGVATAAGSGLANAASTSTDNAVTFAVTPTPPSVTINQAPGQVDPTNAAPINYSVVFSAAVTGFATGDVTLGGTAGATTATVTGSGTTYNVAVTGMTQPGTVTATLGAGVATGATSGLPNAASTSTDNAVSYDTIRPTVTINQAAGQSDPAGAAPINYTVVFSEPATGFATGDVTLSGSAGATTATVTGTGATYTVAVSGMTQSGTVTAAIAAAVATDPAGNTNLASTSTDNTVTYNAPSVPTGTAAAYPFAEGTGTTTADTSGNNLPGTLTNGPTWTTGRVGNGLSFDGVNDFVNLGNPTQLQLTGSMTISAWIFATGAPPINDDAVIVSKRTSGQSGYQLDTTPDTGSRTIGFKLTNSAGANMMRFGATTLQTNQWYHIVGVYDAAASAMHVYLNGVLNDGSLVGTVTATQQNSTQNVNIGRRPGSPGTFEFNGKLDEVQIYNRPLTAGEVQTLYSAGVGPPPTVTINQAVGQADPTNVVPVNYTVVFSEAVTGFATGDVTLGGTAGATTATVTGSGTTYNVAVTGMTQPGTITTTVGAGVATAAGSGLANAASTSTDNAVTFAVTPTPPSVTINQAPGQVDPTNAAPINYSVVFSAAVTGFATGDVTLGGTAGATTATVTGSGTTYNVAVTGMTQPGTVTATLGAGVATGATSGLPNAASTSTDNAVSYDTIRPTVTINQAAGQSDPAGAAPINYTVVFSEPATGFATGDVTLSGSAGATTATVTGTGATYTVAVSGMTQSGTVTAAIAAAVATDPAGNTNLASTSTDNTVTYNAPSVPTGTAAAYPFAEGTGTTTADTSGNNLPGTLTNGPTWTTGRVGNGLSFDGVNDFVNLGNPTQLQLTGSMTISAWIFATGAPPINDDAVIVSKRTSGQSGYQLDTTPDTGSRTIGFKLTNSAGANMMRFGATTLQTNQWYHIVGVYDAAASAMHVYLNGVLNDGSLVGTVTASQENSTQNVNIGRRPGSPGTFEFNGKIDEVAIYGRVISAAEVVALYNAGNPAGSDTIPPQAVMTSPQPAANVNGIFTITADATDNSGSVAGVRFFVDGAPVGAEDTAAPYAFSWDSRTVTNGTHTITATARDSANNVGVSSPVVVNVVNTGSFSNDILTTGLNLPTCIKFLPDGRMLIGELGGKIWILPPGAVQVDSTPFLQLTNVGTVNSQQGLMDIVLDPQFATNNYYYVFYTLGSPNRDRVSRFTANGSSTVAGSEFVLWQDVENADAEHHGGSLNFGNDGKLYITTGEHFNAAEAQSLNNYRGKILRINKDGTIPSDNPFADGSGPNRDEVWALGLRNPYRASYDTLTGWLLIGDVGGNDYSVAKEEVNLGIRGANYGWPNCEGVCGNPAYASPIYFHPHNGRDSAVTGGFVYRGSQFPSEYYGSYFFADYTQNWIRRLTLDANANVTGVFNFEPPDGSVDGPYGDIVYLTEGPDGALYYVDLGYSDIGGVFGLSKIRRIRFISGNQPPTASASATPTSGVPPLTVSFSSNGSADPEGQLLSYSWTFGDGTTSTAPNPNHIYTLPGQYVARLAVSDGTQSTNAAPLTIQAGTTPAVTILSPATGSLFRAGDVIAFSGEATDAEDGVLPPSAFSWRVNLRHSEHVHPGLPQNGIRNGTFTIPINGHDFSGDVYFEFILTVADSTGLQSTTSVLIYPEKTVISFETAPSGLDVTVDGIPHQTPFTLDSLMLFNHVVDAPNQSFAGTDYDFASWSDGGAQQHTLIAPTSPQTFVATFNAATAPPIPGLVARYTFEEGFGLTSTDASGNNNAATLSPNVTWTAGKYGNGVNFNGGSGEAVVNDSPSLDLAASFTLSAWIKADTLIGIQTILVKERSFGACGYLLQTNGTQISSGFNAGSGCIEHVTTTANLATGSWRHVAAVLNRNTNTFQIYLDGLQILNVAETAAPTPNAEDLVLGRTVWGERWNGSLDDVRIYNRALTTSEIGQVMLGAR